MSSPLDLDISFENEEKILKSLSTKKIKEGYFTNMSNKEYHSIDGISSTTLSDLDLSIAIYDNRQHFKYHTSAFDVGSLIHDALAYPNDYKNDYIECETVGMDTKKAAEQRLLNPDKTIVGQGMLEMVEEVVLKTKLIYGSYINIGAKECSFIFKDEDTGLIYKIRPDLHLLEHGIVLDYKSTKETTHAGFLKTIETYNYHRSASFYIDGVNKCIEKFNLPFRKVEQFGWICIPKEEPHKPFGFIASDELVEKGRADYQRLIGKLLEVRETGNDELFKTAFSWEFRKQMNGE